MKTLNSVIIEGNMVRAPVFKITPNGTAMCNFSIA
ncbi:single-stranded DNA-binding protein, partial [Treponema putidum]